MESRERSTPVGLETFRILCRRDISLPSAQAVFCSMQDEKPCSSASKGCLVGSSFPAAGKPARPPFAQSARAVVSSGIFHGRDTVNSTSSLGDSVSQRGEAVGNLTPRGIDTRHRDVRDSARTALFSGERESLSSRQMSIAWRPPAGLPLPSSHGTTVSSNLSSVSAASTGQSSNYAEASAAASFYRQRQQQHSSCIFGDTNDYAYSVGRHKSPSQTTNVDDIHMQREPFPEGGGLGSNRTSSRGGFLQKQRSDQLRAAGVPTAAWEFLHRDQQQDHVQETFPEQRLSPLLRHNGDNVSMLPESQLQHNSLQMNATDSSKSQNHATRQPSTCFRHQGEETVIAPRVTAVQQGQHMNTGGSTSSGAQDWMIEGPLSHSTRQPQHCKTLELSNTASVESERMHGFVHGETSQLGSCKSQEIPGSASEFIHRPEDSTSFSGNISHHSPLSLPTPLPEEHEIDMEHGDPHQEQHRPHEELSDTHRGVEEEQEEDGKKEPSLKESKELDVPTMSRQSHAEEPGVAGELSLSRPSAAESIGSRWSSKTEEGNAALRGSRDTAVATKLSRNDVSSFVPREDSRSSREKHIESLRSTGSVLPVSVTADAAVAAAAAAASNRCHGIGNGSRGTAAGRDGSDNGVGSTGDHSGGRAGGGSSDTHAAPYPLNLMEKSAETRRHAATRAGCARLLPLDIPWHCSATSVLGTRGSQSYTSGTTHGAHSSPTSDGSRGLFSPASSNCSQGASGHPELTARERLLHQHCTSSIFAGEEDDSSDAGSRLLQQQRNFTSSTGTTAIRNRPTPLLEREYGTKDENLQRRADQLQNPWYSDLFGRHTPKRSPTAARCAPAALLANGSEAEAAVGKEGEDTSGRSASGSSAPGSAISGVDGATLDKLCAHRRKTQLLSASNAYERFISAMQSDIWSTVGDDCDAVTQKRLMRAHLAKKMLLQEKCREQIRRQRLKEAVNEGHGKYFHMSTSEEARVGEMGKNVDLLELQMKRAQPTKRNTAELHLFGVRPDMTEEDIVKLCREAKEEGGEKDGCGDSSVGTTTQSGCTARSSRQGLPKCTFQVKLATNILTSQCKGTGRVTLQFKENEVDIDQVVRRLRNANVGVRQVS